MPAVDVELVEETEAERVERWRAEELERAGYAPDTAVILAGRTDVDLHAAVRLLERGCAPELAAEILL
jgi:tRNA U38,U39,U40 pseudouridine synthase TruA